MGTPSYADNCRAIPISSVAECTLKVTREDAENRQAILHIEVEEDRVERHLQQTHHKVAARVDIPGFRKGKAPRRVVEQFVGRDYLLEQAMETLVPESVAAAVKDSDIESTHTPPRVNVVERDPVFKIDATIALAPVATLGDYKKLQFEDDLEVVEESQIEEQLTRVQESQSTWEPVTRSSKMGDMLNIDAKGEVDGKEFANVNGGDYQIEAGTVNPVPGFAEQLKGIREGGSKEFELIVPSDYPSEEFAGKIAKFSVQVSSVKKKETPKLTNAFVVSLGEDLKTVSDLRARIIENLETQAKDRLRRSLEEKIVDALVEGAKFEISPMTIEHEAEHILEDQQRQLAQYNIDFQKYLQGTGKSMDDIVAEARESAELRLKRTLVVDTLVETDEPIVTDEDVAIEVALMQEQPQYADENLDTEEARDTVRRILRRRTTMDQMINLTHKPKTTKLKKRALTTRKKTATKRSATEKSAKVKPTDTIKRTNQN